MKKWLNRAEKAGLVAIIALIPTQLGKHWWPDWSMVAGIPVDYLSPTLYLLDAVWIGWLVARIAGGGMGQLKVNKWWVLLALINIVVAGNKMVAGLGWMRWWQWWTVILAVAGQKEFVKQKLLTIIPFWILIEAGLGLAQVVGGGSVGGVFWWLGERRFSLSSIGTPLWSVEGAEWVRAVGTFSHPNSLAGFIMLTAGWWWTVRSKWGKTTMRRAAGWATLVGMVMIMVLTASRAVWLTATTGALIIGTQLEGWKQKIGLGLIATGLIVVLVGVIGRDYQLNNFVGGWDGESVQKRVVLAKQAGEMIRNNPLFGVGLNNWFNQQAKSEVRNGGWRQPVHNTLALWWAETGLLGMAVAGVSFWKWMKNKRDWGWIAAVVIIGITGMADHYWLTLAQNRWLWGVILAIM